MSEVTRTPSLRDVFVEQFRLIGLSLRIEAAMLLALIGFLTVGIGVSIAREDLALHFRPDNYVLLGILAALIPFGVWKGRARLDESVFMTQPVEHRTHLLTRVAAGWVWLMIVVGLLLAWMSALVLISGGTFASPMPTRTLLIGEPAFGVAMDRASFREVPWTQPAWLWIVPFTGATVAYALVSALNVAARHPLRVVGGVIIGVLLAGFATGEIAFEWVSTGLEPALVHPWGLDTVLTGGTETLKYALVVQAEDGTYDPVTAWRALPTFGAWISATLLWLAFGAAALWAATLQFRERASMRTE